MFDRSVIFLTPDNIAHVVTAANWLTTAWDLANLYLGSVGAAPLGGHSIDLLGLSEETTCFVSMEYFTSKDRYSDYVVHEAAHVFHNCKRGTIGLPETQRREWLLDIEYSKRELFCVCL